VRAERSKKLLLTGYASDLASVVPLLTTRADTILVDEKGFETDLPETADVVVFALSLGGTYSTQLRIVCNRVFYGVSAKWRFLLPVGDVDLDERRFPEFGKVPKISIAELNALLEKISAGHHSNL
jgi:hypothetical protein